MSKRSNAHAVCDPTFSESELSTPAQCFKSIKLKNSSFMDRPHLYPDLQPQQAPLTPILPAISQRMAVTTALFTDTPLTFGEGNIGRIAVNVTANKLLSQGATPRYIAATLTIDRDTPVTLINTIFRSMRDMAVQAEMELITTDTAILESGPVYGMSISTFAIGTMPPDLDFSKRCITPGDVIIATGPVGAYGTAIRAIRHNITPVVTDDGAPLIDITHALLDVVPRTRRIIFPYKGITHAIKQLSLHHRPNIVAEAIPVSDAIRAACRIMDLDPLDMECAGTMLVIVPDTDARAALDAIRRSDYGQQAAIIGHIA